MHGTPPQVLATIGIPSAGQCLAVAAPFLTFLLLRWIIRHTDHAVGRLFPHWEWEKRLGWLHLGNTRRAEAILRWIGYALYALLAAALYGIVWSAPELELLDRWSDPAVFGKMALKVGVLLLCLGFWLYYLAGELFPKLRRQYEADELEKFRAEQARIEKERESRPDSRPKHALESTRTGFSRRH